MSWQARLKEEGFDANHRGYLRRIFSRRRETSRKTFVGSVPIALAHFIKFDHVQPTLYIFNFRYVKNCLTVSQKRPADAFWSRLSSACNFVERTRGRGLLADRISERLLQILLACFNGKWRRRSLSFLTTS
jgi:hypothetical protein